MSEGPMEPLALDAEAIRARGFPVRQCHDFGITICLECRWQYLSDDEHLTLHPVATDPAAALLGLASAPCFGCGNTGFPERRLLQSDRSLALGGQWAWAVAGPREDEQRGDLP